MNQTEQEILRAAQQRYDTQDATAQRTIPLSAFIEEEREKRKPGYQEPLTAEQIGTLVKLVAQTDSKNPFKSIPARLKLQTIKLRSRQRN